MAERTVSVDRLRLDLLEVLRGVEASEEAVVVTKDGRPIARIEPVARRGSLRGSVRFEADDDLLRPVDPSWGSDPA